MLRQVGRKLNRGVTSAKSLAFRLKSWISKATPNVVGSCRASKTLRAEATATLWCTTRTTQPELIPLHSSHHSRKTPSRWLRTAKTSRMDTPVQECYKTASLKPERVFKAAFKELRSNSTRMHPFKRKNWWRGRYLKEIHSSRSCRQFKFQILAVSFLLSLTTSKTTHSKLNGTKLTNLAKNAAKIHKLYSDRKLQNSI